MAGAPLVAFIGVEVSQRTSGKVWGIGAIAADERLAFLGACAGAAGALLGLVIATMAILMALPDGPGLKALRNYSGWRVLQYTLLVSTLNLLLLLIGSLVAIVWPGSRSASGLVTVYAVACGLSLAASGLLFALVLLNVEKDRREG